MNKIKSQVKEFVAASSQNSCNANSLFLVLHRKENSVFAAIRLATWLAQRLVANKLDTSAAVTLVVLFLVTRRCLACFKYFLV